MEVKLVIVLLACLSCLVPPALSAAVYVETPSSVGLHAAVGAVAGAAIKGVAALGVKAVLKTAGVLAAKGLAAKALLAKGAIAGAGAALAASHVGHHVKEHVTSVVVHPPRAPTILGHIAEHIRAAHVSAVNKPVVHTHGYYHHPVHVVQPVVHKWVHPVVQPVAVVGHTMTVHENTVGIDGC